jgi:outer membrane cobalamin receptor
MNNTNEYNCYSCGSEINEYSQLCGRCARNGFYNQSTSVNLSYNISDSWFNYIKLLNEKSNYDYNNSYKCIKNNKNTIEFVKKLINELVNNKINVNDLYLTLYRENIISYMIVSPEYRLNWNE